MRKQMDMSKTLNEECKRYAKMEGMTLNGFITRCIEKGLAYYKAKNLTTEEICHKQNIDLDEATMDDIEATKEVIKKLWTRQ